MNLLDQLVNIALQRQPLLAPLRTVVEKELLHHDILRIMRDHNLLAGLTFIGGTCLRCCYGGTRLSEDLDFTGGQDFSRELLDDLAQVLVAGLQEKYSLPVVVSAPLHDKNITDTWKIKIETRPGSKDMPVQRINIDICALPSYERQPMVLLNLYGVEMGTTGLIVQAQTREEIYADKLIAFALRENRIKYRDVWDIMWLHSQGIKPRLELVTHKLQDRRCQPSQFLDLFAARVELMRTDSKLAREFQHEMMRFLTAEQVKNTLTQDHQLWSFIGNLLSEHYQNLKAAV